MSTSSAPASDVIAAEITRLSDLARTGGLTDYGKGRLEGIEWASGTSGESGTPRAGYWIAYYSDFSGFVIFGHEVDALRHAVDNQMSVKFLPWGQGRADIQ